MARAGFGVSRGRLPGATHDAWPGTAHDWVPRDDGQNPRPGITGLSHDASLGVAEHALPWRSTTQTYEVSPGSAALAPGSTERPTAATGPSWPPSWRPPSVTGATSKPGTRPGAGISGHARLSSIMRRR